MQPKSRKVIDFVVTYSADFASSKHYFSSDKQYFGNHIKYFSRLTYTVFDYSVFIT